MTPEDVRAAIDVLVDVQNESDSMDVPTAVAYRAAVEELRAAARATTDLLDMQLVKILESPRVFDGYLYEVKASDGKWRPDHSKVNATVKRAAVADPDGVVRTPHDAAEEAIAIMNDLYVSPSTMPKTGGLERLGKKKWEVAQQEAGSKVLKVTPTAEAPS